MMKRLIKRGGRTILAGAGLCLASLTGCQNAGTQFANPWASRPMEQPNAMAAMMPTSPAFSRVQAGQNLPVMQSGMMPQQQMMVGQGYPQQGMMPQQQMMAQQPMMPQPVMGSGGMVYPVGYQPGQPPMMGQPQQQQMMPQQGMTYIPQPGPATVYTPNAPVTQAPPIMPAPQPGVSVTQGPNGPITVTTEVFEQPPPTTGGNSPASVSYPPSMVNTPVGQPTAQPGSPSAPTFIAPPPYTVPFPDAPNLPPVGKTPELLPNTVGKAPTGPALPGMNTPAGLGNYPAVPVGHQTIVPPPAKLPTPTGPAAPASPEDDIPAAPIFVPSK